jgi:hypothetical protein
VTAIFRSLLAQLYCSIDEVPSEDLSLYRESLKAGTPLEMSVLHLGSQIRNAIAKFHCTTVIIDALDESSNPLEAASALYRLFEATSGMNFRILVTSRDQIKPLSIALGNRPYIQVLDLKDRHLQLREEVTVYVDERLKEMITSGKFNATVDAALQDAIAAKVKEEAGTM